MAIIPLATPPIVLPKKQKKYNVIKPQVTIRKPPEVSTNGREFLISVEVEIKGTLPNTFKMDLTAYFETVINHKPKSSQTTAQDDKKIRESTRQFSNTPFKKIKAVATILNQKKDIAQVTFSVPRWLGNTPIDNGQSIDVVPVIKKIEAKII